MGRPRRIKEAARPRWRMLRRSALVLLGLVVCLAIALPIIWVQISAYARAMARASLAREAALGRQWTCAGKSTVSGFPFNLTYDCEDARFDGTIGGHSVKASVKGVHASVFLLWPEHPAATVIAPVEIERDDGARMVLAWRRFEAGAHVVPFGIQRCEAAIEKLTATLTMDARQTNLVDAQNLLIGLRQASAPNAEDTAVTIDAALKDAVSPFFEDAVPAGGGVDAHAVATIDQVDALRRGSLSDRLEAWRLAGGRLTITDVHAVKGGSMIDAKGDLGLDLTHMPDGTVDASMAGIEPVLKRYGIPTGVASFGGLLSGFLGGGKSDSAAASRPGALSLRIRLSEGHVYAGPIRLRANLRPLY